MTQTEQLVENSAANGTNLKKAYKIISWVILSGLVAITIYAIFVISAAIKHRTFKKLSTQVKFTIAGQTMFYIFYTIFWGIQTRATEEDTANFMLF